MTTIFVSSLAFSLHAQDATPEPTPVINVTMNEYKFQIEGQDADTALQLEAGKEYEMHFKNGGTLKHEVLIGSSAIEIKDGFHHDFNNLILSDVEVEISGEMDGKDFAIGVPGLNEFELNPGQELTIHFTLPEDKVGDWEMGCFVSVNPDAPEDDPGAGHYDLGMHISVNVVAGKA
jgi:uncharacterized cupredoxin-like copper-binding protein